jgi:predicted lipid-binding transport protein (Tim44 family)
MLRRLGQLRRRVAARHARGWRTRGAAASAGRSTAEIEELLALARLSFLQLQRAWDRADLSAMRLMATAPLLEDLREQLEQRGPEPNRTEVLRLDARLLDVEELSEAFVASVEFTGLIRERQGEGAQPFRELWLLADVKAAGRGWKLARVQSLS